MQQNKVGEQRLFSLFGHFNLLIILLSTSLCAQSFQDFKKLPTKTLTPTKDVKDLDYTSYLKEQWEEYRSLDALKLYEKSKPSTIFSVKEKKIISVGPKIHLKLPKLQKSISPILSEEKIEPKEGISFDFYGAKVSFTQLQSIKNARYFPHNQEGVIKFFKEMLESDYVLNLKELESVKRELKLNDWGLKLLVEELAKQIYTNEDEIRLFTWFMLNKMGYDIKIGLYSQRVVLMYYSENIIYETSYFNFAGKNYYALAYDANEKIKRVYSYVKSFPHAKKALDLRLDTLPIFPLKSKIKTLSFKEFGETYTLSYEYNQNLIDFMSTYPQADAEVFFNAPMEERTYLSLARDIKKYIDTKHSSVGINFVLHLVQKSFQYKTDKLQFGRQKTMFAQEVLYYDMSDCDDRSVLFASLVEKLFGINTVGLVFSNHMSTALYIPMDGDSVTLGKKRFVIADPSEVNANIGESMPGYTAGQVKKFIIYQKEY